MREQEANEYVLGTHDAENVRLRLQHRLWCAEAFACWERAGIKPGSHVLDVGCGPGHGTFDMSDLVGPNGHITGVDESQRFVDFLNQQAEAREVRNVTAFVQDVQSLDVAGGTFDVAFARWVLSFTPRPEAVLAGVAAALRPGGRFAIQDYTHWQGLFLSPGSEAFLEVLKATDRSWRGSGGDYQIGKRLPRLLEDAGLVVESFRPLQRIARSTEPLWHWPTSFFLNWVPLLVERGFLTDAQRAAFESDWEARSKDPQAFLWTPPMVEIIARKT
jgi:ubiquinone/menaquinone biosynthesis C-methylase UbiE